MPDESRAVEYIDTPRQPPAPGAYRYALLAAHFHHHYNIHLTHSDVAVIDRLSEIAASA